MIEGPLMSKIDLILKDTTLDAQSKQVSIEKLGLEYDLAWFQQEIKNSIDTISVILHDIYKTFEASLKYITQPYLKNCWLKFKSRVREMPIGTTDSINKKYISLKCVIVILILGADSVISTSFKSRNNY